MKYLVISKNRIFGLRKKKKKKKRRKHKSKKKKKKIESK